MAYALNCPRVNETREFQACLRNRSVQDLLSVKIDKPKYVPAFAPLVDGSLVPSAPHKIMEQNPEVLAKYVARTINLTLEESQERPAYLKFAPEGNSILPVFPPPADI